MAGGSESGALRPPRPPLPSGEELRDSSSALITRASELTDHLPRALAWLEPVEATSRLFALDAARALATFGVMWTHVVEVQIPNPALAAVGRFGTSFYVAASVFVSTRAALRRPDTPFWANVRVRVRRLLLPFLLWSLIYAGFYTAQTIAAGRSLEGLLTWWGPFAGAGRHLWFLPFAFVMGVIASWSAPHIARVSTEHLIRALVLLTPVAYWLGHDLIFFAMDRIWMIDHHLHRLDRWPEEIPLVLVTIGLSHLYFRYEQSGGPAARPSTLRPPPPPPPEVDDESDEASTAARPAPRSTFPKSVRELAVRPAGVAPVLALAFVATETFYYVGYDLLTEVSHSEARYLANLAGLCLLGSFLMARPRRWMQTVGGLGTVTYFAFLVHVLLIDAAGSWPMGFPGFMTVPFSLACTVVLFTVATSLGAVIRRVPLFRFLIP